MKIYTIYLFNIFNLLNFSSKYPTKPYLGPWTESIRKISALAATTNNAEHGLPWGKGVCVRGLCVLVGQPNAFGFKVFNIFYLRQATLGLEKLPKPK